MPSPVLSICHRTARILFARATRDYQLTPDTHAQNEPRNRLISELALLKTAAATAADDACAAGTTTSASAPPPPSSSSSPSLSRQEASGHLVGLLSALSDCVSALDGSGRGRHDALLGQALSLPVWSVDEVKRDSVFGGKPPFPFSSLSFFFFSRSTLLSFFSLSPLLPSSFPPSFSLREGKKKGRQRGNISLRMMLTFNF